MVKRIIADLRNQNMTMGEHMKKLLTAGTFAKLCDTTKATLRWYRKTGLLEPAELGSNGYAYYAVSQSVAFFGIRALQNVGCSLEQIKALQADEALLRSDSLVDEQIQRLDQRIHELKGQRAYLTQMLATQRDVQARWGEHPSEGDWHISHREQECYLVMRAPITHVDLYKRRLKSFQQACYEMGLGANVPIVVYLDERGLSLDQFEERFCICTKIDDPHAIQERLSHVDFEGTEIPYLLHRKAGNYLDYLTSLPLEADDTDTLETLGIAASGNPMIEGQRAALRIALREGCTLKMGMLETAIASLPQKNGAIQLLLEASFAMF